MNRACVGVLSIIEHDMQFKESDITVSFRWAWREVRVEKTEAQALFGRPWIGMIILKCEDINGF